MEITVTMPRLSTSGEDGVLVRWLKQTGDAVRRDEPLAEVETDKATLEIPSPNSGTLRQLLVAEGDRVSVGDNLAVLAASDGAPLESPVSQAQPLPLPPAERLIASPAARKRARGLGVGLESLVGSGPGGRIQLQDVERAAPKAEPVRSVQKTAAAPPVVVGKWVPLSRIRATIARRMVESSRTIPQFAVSRTVDVGKVLAFKNSLAANLGKAKSLNISLTDFLVQAVARSLQRFPYLNASLVGEPGEPGAGYELHQAVHLGLAVAGEDGLRVPVIRDAQARSLVELASMRRDLVERAGGGRLRGDEAGGSTFTLSNLGPLGADFFTALVNPPEAAILAVGRVVEQPVVYEGQVVVRPLMTLTVSVDHRIVDGAPAAAFLADLAGRIEASDDWELF